MKFLPDDYTSPSSSNYYMKFVDGENKIRILSQPILGWEDWVEKKPVRFRFNNKPMKSHDPIKPVRHFWAFIVWNYNEEQIQILEITQATIKKQLEALTKDADWGAPYFYDIKIMKSGEGLKTEYTVNPLPHKPLNDYIKKMFEEKPCFLDALFDNADPFAPEWRDYTPGIFERKDSVVVEKVEEKKPIITTEQGLELLVIFEKCDPVYKKQLLMTIAKHPTNAKNLSELPADLYDRIKIALSKNRDEYQAKMPEIEELPF
jgi:hypothetical protein